MASKKALRELKSVTESVKASVGPALEEIEKAINGEEFDEKKIAGFIEHCLWVSGDEAGEEFYN